MPWNSPSATSFSRTRKVTNRQSLAVRDAFCGRQLGHTTAAHRILRQRRVGGRKGAGDGERLAVLAVLVQPTDDLVVRKHPRVTRERRRRRRYARSDGRRRPRRAQIARRRRRPGHAAAEIRPVRPELLEDLGLLPLPVLAHVPIERAVEVADDVAPALLDRLDDRALVRVADEALDVVVVQRRELGERRLRVEPVDRLRELGRVDRCLPEHVLPAPSA